jgi:hypothetical protein
MIMTLLVGTPAIANDFSAVIIADGFFGDDKATGQYPSTATAQCSYVVESLSLSEVTDTTTGIVGDELDIR